METTGVGKGGGGRRGGGGGKEEECEVWTSGITRGWGMYVWGGRECEAKTNTREKDARRRTGETEGERSGTQICAHYVCAGLRVLKCGVVRSTFSFSLVLASYSHSLVLAAPYSLSVSLSLPPSLSLSSSCPCSHSRRYQAAIVPSVVKMFASNDRALRIQLLQTLESYVANLGDALIEKTLFTQVRELVLYLYLQVSNTRSLATYLHCRVKINRHLAET